MKKKSSKRGKNKAIGAVSPPRRSYRKERALAAMTGAGGAKIKARAGNFSPKSQETYMRAMAGKSRKDAMTSFCTMCMGYQSEEVKRCTDSACPLFPYRR